MSDQCQSPIFFVTNCIPPHRDGRLQESDQILAIDGQPLDKGMSHQAAIAVLQQARGDVELIVSRGGIPRSGDLSRTTSGASSFLSRTPSDVSSVSHTSNTLPVSEQRNNNIHM